jgi:hypothetical protein
MTFPRITLAFILASAAVGPPGGARGEDLTLTPARFALHGKTDRQRLLVTATADGRLVDRGREAHFFSETPAVVAVSADGVVTPVGDGTGTVVVRVAGQEARATVQVTGGRRFLPVTFERDVLPLLGRAGCNAGACHGKARGQNGFQLSLLGFDADFDHAALTREARGRRVFPAAPQNSLLLLKASARVAHGGGKRFEPASVHYETLLRWIADGTPRTPPDSPALERITVEPGERILANRAAQQLLVTAHYTDGSRRDVTHLATFQSNDGVVAAVRPEGLVQAGPLPGEAAVMARFMEKFAVCNIIIPMAGSVPAGVYDRLPRNNFIDGHVWDKLRRLGITPSDPAGDSTFLRRAHLDAIGRLPTPGEVREFWRTGRRTNARGWWTACWPGRSTRITGRTSGPTCCGPTPTASASRPPSPSTPGCATPSAATSPTTSSSARSSPPRGAPSATARPSSSGTAPSRRRLPPW